MNPHFAGVALLAGLSLIAAGCGDAEPSRIPVFPVAGTLLADGRPAAKYIVRFHPLAAKLGPRNNQEVATIATETDDAGRFHLSTYLADDGAPAGDYIVTILPGGLPEVEDGDGLSPRPPESADLTKYSDVDTSPFKATIKTGDNRFDYEMK